MSHSDLVQYIDDSVSIPDTEYWRNMQASYIKKAISMNLPLEVALTYSVIWKNIKKYKSVYNSELQEKCFEYCPDNLKNNDPLQDDILYRIFG